MRSRALAHPGRHGFLRALHPPTVDLIEAVLCIGWEDHGLDGRATTYALLEQMTSTLTLRLRDTVALHEKIAALNNFLFTELGFTGNHQEYYHVDNSYFDRVLSTKKGLPIMLALLYITLAQRVGVVCDGVAFPGHFMVQCSDGVHAPIVIDPFRNGHIWSMSDCAAYLVQQGVQTPLRDMLHPPSPQMVIERVLRNLKGSYLAQSDFVNAANALERILLTNPESALDVRDYGLVLGRLGLPQMALIYLERYIKLAPTATDHASIRRYATTLLGQIVS